MPHWERLEIYKRDRFHCLYCDFDGTSFDMWPFLEIDHINPLGARDDPTNLATCCHRCNGWKGNTPCTSVEEAKQIIAQAREWNRQFWEKNVKLLLPPSLP